MKKVKYALLFLILSFAGCGLQNYDRKYSISYRDADGREINSSVTFAGREPVITGFAK